MRGDPVTKGAEAEMILNHPVFKSACESLEKEIMQKIATAKFDGTKDAERYREKLNLLLYCQQKYKQILNNAIQNGKVASDAIERKKLFSKGL